MKLIAQAVLTTLLLASPMAIALAHYTQAPQPPKPPVSVADLRKALGSPETVTATITAIDHEQRMVVLKGESGAERTLFVGPEVTKFKNLKVGDRIKMTYYMSLGTEFVPPGESGKSGRVSAAVGTAGATAGGTIAEQARWLVTVKSVDVEKSIVTVTTEQGRTISFKAEDKNKIAQLKPNDRLEVVLTAAAIVSVEPAPPAN
jgi:hypothetical protein